VHRSEAKKETKPAVPLTPEEEEKAAYRRALDMSAMFLDYAVAHQGHLPPDLSALVACGLMDGDRAGEFLKGVIEYRGSEMTNSDRGALTVMRYRIGKRTDKEVRTSLARSVRYCDPAEPIPEDAAEAETPVETLPK
jgi:hypothetical protein